MTRALTIRLDTEDYDHLEHDAQELGVSPTTLGRILIRSGLLDRREISDIRMSGALERAAELRLTLAGNQSVDAVALVRQGREELDRRGSF